MHGVYVNPLMNSFAGHGDNSLTAQFDAEEVSMGCAHVSKKCTTLLRKEDIQSRAKYSNTLKIPMNNILSLYFSTAHSKIPREYE